MCLYESVGFSQARACGSFSNLSFCLSSSIMVLYWGSWERCWDWSWAARYSTKPLSGLKIKNWRCCCFSPLQQSRAVQNSRTKRKTKKKVLPTRQVPDATLLPQAGAATRPFRPVHKPDPHIPPFHSRESDPNGSLTLCFSTWYFSPKNHSGRCFVIYQKL